MTAEAGPVTGNAPVADLVMRARDGDQQAWDAIVERYAPLVWAICRRHRLASADAEDAGQAVWLQLVDHIGQIRNPAALPGWLATTTGRECSRLVRAARQTCPPGGQVLDPEDIADEQAVLADDELLRLERHAALREALALDPPLPYAQISARLGIPVGSIGPTRSRCLAKLRRHPAIAALASAGPANMTNEPPAHAVTS